MPWLTLYACAQARSPEPAEDASSGVRDAGDMNEARDAEPPPKIATPLDNEALGRGAGCDLSGRWIMTEHQSIVVLGSNQLAIKWFYVEMTQQDEQVTMTTAMSCGRTTIGLAPVEVQIDDSPAWPAYMKHVRYDGRKGASIAQNGKCHISFETGVLVHGATTSKYRDLSIALPELDQQADAETPGWEDWDDDGHPGVTMSVSGTIWGSIYENGRTWTEYDGEAPRDAGSILLGQKWNQERVTLGYDGSAVLVYEGARDANETHHTVELTRLLPEQATGDDPAKCSSIRQLAETLTPNANARFLQ